MRRAEAGAVLQILHAERDAGQRAGVVASRHLGVDVRGGAFGGVAVKHHEGVQHRILGFDGVERLSQDANCAQPAATHSIEISTTVRMFVSLQERL